MLAPYLPVNLDRLLRDVRHSELFTQNASPEIALGDETRVERAAGGPGA